MNIKLSQHLPKTHTQKILKKEAKSKDDACLVVLVDDKKNILANSMLTDYTARIEQLIEVSHFKGTACETVADYALAGDKKTTKTLYSYCWLVSVTRTNSAIPYCKKLPRPSIAARKSVYRLLPLP